MQVIIYTSTFTIYTFDICLINTFYNVTILLDGLVSMICDLIYASVLPYSAVMNVKYLYLTNVTSSFVSLIVLRVVYYLKIISFLINLSDKVIGFSNYQKRQLIYLIYLSTMNFSKTDTK